MLNTISHLDGSKVSASDGDIGQVNEVYFDDRHWTVRYLVVDTGTWLSGREVLISPYLVRHPLGADKQVQLALTREQVQHSPDIDTHKPVSRQQESELLSHYRYPAYWDGTSLWGMGALPYPPAPVMTAAEREANRAMLERDGKAADVHLRSSAHVTGYDIQASDGSIGQVQDFVFDDDSWTIRYLVVDTSAWWQGGHPVLIGAKWADSIDWATRKVHLNLTRAQVRASPLFDDVSAIRRDDEEILHRNYERPGYWT